MNTGCKILLVNTNRIRPPIAPIALDYLAAALRTEGHAVRMLDYNLAADCQAATAVAFDGWRPDLIGLTFRNTDDCFFESGVSFVDILKDDIGRIRKFCDSPIVVGGSGFAVKATAVLDACGADYGVHGDGEPAMCALARAVTGQIQIAQVPGLIYRTAQQHSAADRGRAGARPSTDVTTSMANRGRAGARPSTQGFQPGTWHRNPVGYADLENLRLAARDFVDNRTYFKFGGQVGVETKRGCTGKCVYCADPIIKGSEIRTRLTADVVQELRNLLAQDIDYFHFCDSEFNLPASHATAVCRAIIDAGLRRDVHWYVYASPSAFSEKLMILMKHAGCAGINFGVDSGNDKMLAALGRDYDRSRLAEITHVCRDIGITVMFDLLLGGPGETRETLAETIDFMKQAAPDRVGVSLGIGVCPGTKFAELISQTDAEVAGDGLAPAYYISSALGDNPAALLRELIGGDRRFFFPTGDDDGNYNYSDNAVLERAIESGYRGAYWDVLRKLQDNVAPP
jgi:tryptophan 2-C-methyltransferase